MLRASKLTTGDKREATRPKLETSWGWMPEREQDETGRDIPRGAPTRADGNHHTSIQVSKYSLLRIRIRDPVPF